MKIEWNKVTWYSKLGAIVLFVLIVPVLTFYIGMQYEETAAALDHGIFFTPGIPVKNIPDHPSACTDEAKLCPDGTYVGRTGPNCEFKKCPDSTAVGQGTLEGTVSIGPNCPVEQVGHPCTPSPEAYASHKVLVYNSDRTKLVSTLVPDTQGKFSGTLPAGDYYVDVAHQAIGAVRGVPATARIVSGKTATLAITIDTGIR